MLYNEAWNKTTTKPDVFSLESLIAWLEQQPAEKAYCYIDGGDCLIHQYLTYVGIPVDRVSAFGEYREVGGGERKSAPTSFWKVSIGSPSRDWTFGAALKRARKLAFPELRTSPPRQGVVLMVGVLSTRRERESESGAKLTTGKGEL